MKIQKIIVSLAVASAMPLAAYAQESSTTTDTATSTTIKKSDTGASDLKDTDQEITNAKLRAESGSKKKFSFRSTFTYNGSNLQKPLAPNRPNFTGAVENDPDTNIRGEFGVKYRMNDRSNLSLRMGMQVRRPFGGDLADRSNKAEVFDPKLTYEYVEKTESGWQLISGASVDAGTSRFRQDKGDRSTLNVSEIAMYSLGNGWDLGGVLDLNATVYGQSAGQSSTTYNVGIYPIAEYAFNDRYSFRTVFRYFTVQSKSRLEPNSYDRIYGSQSVGIGIAVTRDIYLYPNIQFAPQNLRADVTNWGLTTNINL